MVAGDFLEVYANDPMHHGAWDAIVSCFFLDTGYVKLCSPPLWSMWRAPKQTNKNYGLAQIRTAHNILEYLDACAVLLKPGGYLLNLGPLMYHFEDLHDPSVEFTWDELKGVMNKLGLEIIEEKMDIKCHYTYNKESMLQMFYNCVFFVARKIEKGGLYGGIGKEKEKEKEEEKKEDRDGDDVEMRDVGMKGPSEMLEVD